MTAQDYMENGKHAYQRGHAGEAALHWTEAAKLYEQGEEPALQSKALMYLAQALQDMGQTHNAEVTLQMAHKQATDANDWPLVAHILDRLGIVYLRLGKEPQALTALAEGLKLARAQENSSLGAALLNDIGNTLMALDRYNAALGAYTESAILAKNTGNATLATVAQINAATSEMEQRRLSDAQSQLDFVYTETHLLPDSHDKATGLLRIGLAYRELSTRVLRTEHDGSHKLAEPGSPPQSESGQRGILVQPLPRKPEGPSMAEPEAESTQKQAGATRDDGAAAERARAIRKKARDAFNDAIALATELQDPISQSYGLGYLAQLSAEETRWEESLTLARRAIGAIHKTDAPEVLYRWHWQLATGYRALGQRADARQAYQQAMATLNPIRHEYMAGASGKKRPFRDTIGRLYFEYADFLLQQAAASEPEHGKTEYLVEARQTIEAFKAAELQDYFQDQCVEVARLHGTSLDAIAHDTVVLYPIALPDRLELLVSAPAGISQFVVPVPEPALRQEIRLFREAAEDRRNQGYLVHAQKLYNWLMRPIEPLLHAQNEPITTIVFVPDGPLGAVPFAALHNGEDYLITRYAVAITPGLILTDTRPLDRQRIKLLGLGLTKETQGFPPLPNVEQELLALKNLYEGKILLNEQFQVTTLEQELQTQEFNVVHIASHGLFDRAAENTFVLAYDEKITVDRLAEAIGVFKFGAQPLGLLTLSACQTAVGDDRAALGLAGIAIKAGAQSALATLWFIDDQATSQLIPEFYRQIHENPSISKAVALQRAQVKFLNDPVFTHPSYWAPFLLINNWL